MKHIYALAAAFVALSSIVGSSQASAQSKKISAEGRLFMAAQKSPALRNITEKHLKEGFVIAEEKQPEMSAMSATPGFELTTIPRVMALVKMNDGVSPESLTKAGYDVLSTLPSFAIVNVGLDEVDALAELKGVKGVSFGHKDRLYLDMARQKSQTDAVHTGIEMGGQTYAFTGKGVYTGIYDTGVAPNHVNFLNEDGTPRVKQLLEYAYDEDDDTQINIYNYNATGIAQFETDDPSETHGTHTLGIMAGGYRGNVRNLWYEFQTDGSVSGGYQTTANPYYGMAPESDLLVCAGILDGAATVHGMTQMAAKAKEDGQPLVINYSAGSIVGPHDGTSYTAQAMGEIANEYGAIICVAAGNDGGNKCSFSKTISSTSDSYKTCVTPPDGYIGSIAYIDIYGDDDTPFSVNFSCYKPKTSSLSGEANTSLFTINDVDQVQHYYSVRNTSGTTYSSALNTAFSAGEVLAYSEVDPNNGRYHVYAIVYYQRKKTSIFGSTYTESFIHLNITGKAGQHVMGTLGQLGEFTAQSTISGSVDGNDENSISDTACNEGVISVGAYVAKESYASLGGSVWTINESVRDAVASFSSYGPTADGRQLPDVIAPGYAVISSYSPYYIATNDAAGDNATGETSDDMSADVTDSSTSTTYHWGEMSGTSMACPAVAGTIALWLEADPTLNVYQIREILGKTSTVDDKIKGSTGRYGSGKINATEGLKEILSRIGVTGINGIEEDESNLIFEQDASGIDVFVAGQNGITVNVYSTQGALVTTANTGSDRLRVDTDGLASGIYVVEILPQGGGRAVRKIAVR